jgi:hypothetical protein
MGKNKNVRFLPIFFLICLIAAVAYPPFLKAQQQRLSDKYVQEQKNRRDKVIQEIISFFKDELKNEDAAQKISDWYKQGKIVFGPTDIGIAEYAGGKITIREDYVDSMVDIKDGTVKFGDIVSLSSSLAHEFTHADQSWIYWGRSENSNWLFGYHPAELDAYVAAWAAMQGWISTKKSQLDSMPEGATACERAPEAEKIQQLCSAFVNYYEAEMKNLDIKKRPEAMKHLDDLEKELPEKEKELEDLRQKEKELKSLLGGFDRISKTLDQKKDPVPEIEKEIAAKEKELAALKKEIYEIKEKTWLDLDKHTWTTADGKKMSNEEAVKQVKQLSQQMQNIVAECEKEKKKEEQKSPSAALPKDLSSLTDKEKASLYGELCRCSCNPTVGGGAKYDAARGCVCSGPLGGEWTVPMVLSGDCFDRATAAAGVDPKELAGQIYKDNYEIYKKLIEEARRIIEEYIVFKPGLYRKKSALEGPGENGGYVLLARNFSEDGLNGQELYAATAGGAAISYVEVVKEKNSRGDPDRALGLVRAAEAFMPERKASGETTNILAEFAIIMSKASLNIVTELEFDDGLYLLHKAAEFYKGGESNPIVQTMKGLISSFEKWKNDWQVVQAEVPNCLSMIKDKRVCECDRLNREKITPASNSFVVYAHASPQKWEISTAYGTPRPIPKKDKLIADLKQTLEPALRKCAAHPAMKTKDMTQLRDYDTYKTIEKSPYINQEEHRKYSALPISDEQAIKKAEKLLGEPGLCDCERDKINAILDTAKEGFKYSKLEVDLTASKKSLRLGEYLRVSLLIKSGRKPYTYVMTGDLTANVRGTEVGVITEYPPKTAGTKTVKAVVTDAAGDTRTASVTFDVIAAGTSSAKKQPSYDPTKDPNIKGSGTRSVDIAQVEKHADEFQQTQRSSKKTGDRQSTQQGTTSQPESYVGAGKKQDETKKTEGATQTYNPSLPYSYPPPGGDRSGGNWTDWAKTPTKESSVSGTPSGGSTPSGSTSSGSTTSTGSSGISTGTSQGVYIRAVIKNQSDQDVHVSADSNKLFGSYGSETRLAPGQSREVQIEIPPNRITFYAGRNGQIITSKSWDADPDHLNRYPMVYFTRGMGGKEELAITTNLK